MKKRLMAMILLCVMAFSLVSCGGSSGGASAFKGTWKLESVEAEGMSVGKEMLSSLGMDNWSVEISSDSKVKMNIMGETSPEIEGKVDGNTLTVSEGGETFSFVIEDGKLVLDAGEDGKMVFAK
ncbi:MAG: hypothetical protein IJP92_09205 [Lachnospiraceae bacterium]|nr:hypothetical protein [Lachnospiraceae bacterium]